MSKTLKRILGGLAAIGVVVLLALPKLPSSDGDANGAASAQPPDRRLLVNTHVVAPETLSDKIFTTGTMMANEAVELRSEISGKVTEISFEEGRPVRTGEVLLKIDDQELQARLQQAEFRKELAQDREQRQRQLLDKGGISQEEYEATLNERNVLEAEIELIQAQIDKTELRAPFDGVIGLRRVSEGSYISPNTLVAELHDLDPIKIDFSIPEKYARRVDVGDEIVFTVEGLDTQFTGTIYAFEPRVEEDTRTLRLRARSPNPGNQLLPGAFADVELIFEQIEGALTVPAIAVIPELGGKKVYVYENGTAQSRQVQTGIRTENRVQVVEGLAAGDTVITSGIQQLRSGLSVRLPSAE